MPRRRNIGRQWIQRIRGTVEGTGKQPIEAGLLHVVIPNVLEYFGEHRVLPVERVLVVGAGKGPSERAAGDRQ